MPSSLPRRPTPDPHPDRRPPQPCLPPPRAHLDCGRTTRWIPPRTGLRAMSKYRRTRVFPEYCPLILREVLVLRFLTLPLVPNRRENKDSGPGTLCSLILGHRAGRPRSAPWIWPLGLVSPSPTSKVGSGFSVLMCSSRYTLRSGVPGPDPHRFWLPTLDPGVFHLRNFQTRASSRHYLPHPFSMRR